MSEVGKQELRVSRTSFSWFPFWMAGFLFTLGYVGPDPLMSTYPLWEQFALWIASWFLWPLILGIHLAN